MSILKKYILIEKFRLIQIRFDNDTLRIDISTIRVVKIKKIIVLYYAYTIYSTCIQYSCFLLSACSETLPLFSRFSEILMRQLLSFTFFTSTKSN